MTTSDQSLNLKELPGRIAMVGGGYIAAEFSHIATCAGAEVTVLQRAERILGAHLVGPHADEVINLFALAIRHDLTAEDLKQTIFVYPTAASDIGYML